MNKDRLKTKVCKSASRVLRRAEKQDDTDYLMSNPANKKFIEESLKEVKEGKVRKVELFRL